MRYTCRLKRFQLAPRRCAERCEHRSSFCTGGRSSIFQDHVEADGYLVIKLSNATLTLGPDFVERMKDVFWHRSFDQRSKVDDGKRIASCLFRLPARECGFDCYSCSACLRLFCMAFDTCGLCRRSAVGSLGRCRISLSDATKIFSQNWGIECASFDCAPSNSESFRAEAVCGLTCEGPCLARRRSNRSIPSSILRGSNQNDIFRIRRNLAW